MKQFTGLLLLVGTSAMTIGCASESQVLTVKNPFKNDSDPFQTDGDPFEAAAAAMPNNGAPSQPEVAAQRSIPGYAVVNGASNSAVPHGSQAGWNTTRHASPTADSATPQQPWQTAAVPQDNVQLSFRVATPLPESQTEVVNSATTPENETNIPAIGNSVSRETVSDDPFEQGSVTTAEFIETDDDSTITQLGAERRSPASPATLELPVFAEGREEETPVGQASSQPADEPEWWDQSSGTEAVFPNQ